MRLNIAKAKAFYAQVRLVRIINLTVILHTVLRDGALMVFAGSSVYHSHRKR